MAEAKHRQCTEEELYVIGKEVKKPEAKVIPMHPLEQLIPAPPDPPATAKVENSPSWIKRNQTFLIVLGVTVLITGIIIWDQHQKQKRNKQLQ